MTPEKKILLALLFDLENHITYCKEKMLSISKFHAIRYGKQLPLTEKELEILNNVLDLSEKILELKTKALKGKEND